MKKIYITLDAMERNELSERKLENYIRANIDIETLPYDEFIYYSDNVIEVDILRYSTYKEEIISIS